MKKRLKKLFPWLPMLVDKVKWGAKMFPWRLRSWMGKKRFKGKKNPDKLFYVLRRIDPRVGLGSLISVFLAQLADMEERHPKAIPVIDLKNYPNALLGKGELHKFDAWSFFYEQPGGFSLEEALESRNVLYALDSLPVKRWRSDSPPTDQVYWQNIFHKYFRLNETILKKVEDGYRQLFDESDFVLGVLFRGTDYVQLKPKDHPIQPSIEQMEEKIRQILQTSACNKIYFTSEDADATAYFEKAFGQQLATLNPPRLYSEKNQALNSSSVYKKVGGRQITENYLISLYILARCNGFIAGRTSGSILVPLIRNRPFEVQYLWDLGKY